MEEKDEADIVWERWEGLTFDLLALVLPMLSPSQRKLLEHGLYASLVTRAMEEGEEIPNDQAIDRQAAYTFAADEVHNFRAGSGELDTHTLAGDAGEVEPQQLPLEGLAARTQKDPRAP